MTTPNSEPYETIIIGAGIVGSALAALLSGSQPSMSSRTLLIDRSLSELLGSTAYAPGFLGQFNESDALTRLAVDSLKDYDRFPGVFHRAGGLEFAASDDGVKKLKERCRRANEAGVPARILAGEECDGAVPGFVGRESFKKALYFPTDGVADPRALCAAYCDVARGNGVEVLEADVEGLDIVDGIARGVRTSSGSIFKGHNIVIATGIWTSFLTEPVSSSPIPVVPVAHPYVYTAEKSVSVQTPFCRWPEDHVYARDHGNRFGLGSYAHAPIHVDSPARTASEPWPMATFKPIIEEAAKSKISPDAELALLASMDPDGSSGIEKINGVFSVTPDGLPLLGPAPGVKNLWLASAIWITHAAGSARLLARMMRGEAHDEDLARALDPARFASGDARELEQTALRQYNDIYRTELKD